MWCKSPDQLHRMSRKTRDTPNIRRLDLQSFSVDSGSHKCCIRSTYGWFEIIFMWRENERKTKVFNLIFKLRPPTTCPHSEHSAATQCGACRRQQRREWKSHIPHRSLRSLTCPIDNACKRHIVSVHVRSIPADHIPDRSRGESQVCCSSQPSRFHVAMWVYCVHQVSCKFSPRSSQRPRKGSDSWRSHWNRWNSLNRATMMCRIRLAMCKDLMELNVRHCRRRPTSVESDWLVCHRISAAISRECQLGWLYACRRWWFEVTSVLRPFRPRSERSWTAIRQSCSWPRRGDAQKVMYSSCPMETLAGCGDCPSGRNVAWACTEHVPKI